MNRELACLKAMFNHALKERHDFPNPVERVDFLPENNEQTRVLTFTEQAEYLRAASVTLKDVASIILETGMRQVPLNTNALAIVKRRAQAAKGEYLFPHKKDKNKPTLKVNNTHTRTLEKSKVQYFRLYDLRHTWATRAAGAGVDVGTLASLLGHSKLVMW